MKKGFHTPSNCLENLFSVYFLIWQVGDVSTFDLISILLRFPTARLKHHHLPNEKINSRKDSQDNSKEYANFFFTKTLLLFSTWDVHKVTKNLFQLRFFQTSELVEVE